MDIFVRFDADGSKIFGLACETAEPRFVDPRARIASFGAGHLMSAMGRKPTSGATKPSIERTVSLSMRLTMLAIAAMSV